MKRILIALLIVLFLSTGTLAGEWCKQSTQKTADAAITTSEGVFYGIIFSTDSANYVDVDVYDNASAASGTKLIPTTRITTSATDRVQSISFMPPIRFYNGIYVDITCSGTINYMVYWGN